MNNDIREIEAMLRRLEDAENNHTPDVMVDMLAEDAVIMVPDFDVQEGRTACAQFLREIDTFLAGAFDRRIHYVSAEVRVVGELAFDRGSFSFAVFLRDTIEARINRGKYLLLYTRAAQGRWQLSRGIVSRDEPEDALRVREVKRDDLPFLSECVRPIALEQTSATPIPERTVDALVWELNGCAVGVSTLTDIEYGKGARIEPHMIDPDRRRCGYGHRFVALSLREFFRRFDLKCITCEPPSHDIAANGLLQKLGFAVAATGKTVRSNENVESEINRYEITAVPPPL